jgi:hypothetical protein
LSPVPRLSRNPIQSTHIREINNNIALALELKSNCTAILEVYCLNTNMQL